MTDKGPHPATTQPPSSSCDLTIGTGTVAAWLAAALQRGIVVDCRVSPMLPMRDVVDLIGPNGPHTYDAVVFVPCSLEGQFTPGRSTERRLEGVVRHLVTTGRAGLALVLLALPQPDASSPLDAAIADAAWRQAQMMRRVTFGRPGMRTVEAPTFGSVHDPRPFDPACYRRTAEVLATALAPLLAPLASRGN